MDRQMLLFLRWVLVAGSIAVLCFCCVAWAAFRFPEAASDLGYPKAWMSVLRCANAAKRNIGSDTLYIGDSVAGQIMPYNGKNVLTSNGSVYAVGNYLLVDDALSNNPDITTVIYMSIPQVIGHKFERRRTWNNFVKPFWLPENVERLDSTVTDKLDKYPASWAQLFIPVKFLPISEVDMENGVKKPLDVLSPFAIHWLQRLNELCEERNVAFRIASPPVARNAVAESNDWSAMRQQVPGTGLEELFEMYFRSIASYPDSMLKDRMHWKREFVEADREEMIARMMAGISTK
jgi:hypothetical protein